jgi:hypothetical protein
LWEGVCKMFEEKKEGWQEKKSEQMNYLIEQKM